MCVVSRLYKLRTRFCPIELSAPSSPSLHLRTKVSDRKHLIIAPGRGNTSPQSLSVPPHLYLFSPRLPAVGTCCRNLRTLRCLISNPRTLPPFKTSQRLAEAEESLATKQREGDDVLADLEAARQALDDTARAAKAAAEAASREAANREAATQAEAKTALEELRAKLSKVRLWCCTVHIPGMCLFFNSFFV